jgi:hypothetical protein
MARLGTAASGDSESGGATKRADVSKMRDSLESSVLIGPNSYLCPDLVYHDQPKCRTGRR